MQKEIDLLYKGLRVGALLLSKIIGLEKVSE